MTWPRAIEAIESSDTDELLRVVVEVGEAPSTSAWIEVDPSATPEVAARRARWIRGEVRA